MAIPSQTSRVCIGVVALFLMTGTACRKARKSASEAAELVPVQAPEPASAPTATATETTQAPTTEDAVAKFRNSSEFADLSKAYQVYYLQQKRHTTDLQDLVRAKYLRAIPPPPPGKSYAVDQKQLKVVLVP